MNTTAPTSRTYGALQAAYDHFNEYLFGNELPSCIITLQRHARAYGYFSGDRFANRDDAGEIRDEIALNPQHFQTRTTEQTLSTLVHEMAHLWQHHHGKPPRRCYHNKEWAAKMIEVGLVPSDTGTPGGKTTGEKVSHYIAEAGPFALACADFLARHGAVLFSDRAGDQAAVAKAKKNRTKYTCPSCQMNAWGKPALQILCIECDEQLEPEE